MLFLKGQFNEKAALRKPKLIITILCQQAKGFKTHLCSLGVKCVLCKNLYAGCSIANSYYFSLH